MYAVTATITAGPDAGQTFMVEHSIPTHADATVAYGNACLNHPNARITLVNPA